ncbi:D-alanine--D-alanine ligase [Guyparkeria hydrothermalis]|uniref:D-alanine--D-alanine ligase n=1 Tax=Guyparkeria TaxID=2035712 RepID=UPI0010AB8A9F|nr:MULTISPECIES: D-alanine--D-alanine ligase [Guyparkeria]MCL7750461.1 D-alanine--D-alanine ligase [Guyparkeria hydrothermalis]TKA90574.1 D-alanine--D-alanine ligase [Guyparkeria sp. SB14A]
MSDRTDNLGRVMVLMGGWSAEREVSLASGRAVHEALVSRGVDAIAIDLDQAGARGLGQRLIDERIDRVFIALHGRGGEDGQVQALLELAEVPYTGSGMAASAIGMDKVMCKRIWQGAGLDTPAFAVVGDLAAAREAAGRLGWPVIVKPTADGSSVGVSKVDDADGIETAFREAAAFGEVMVEQFVNGGEYTVAILGERSLPAIRIEASAEHAFYDYQAKYEAEDTGYRIPCGLAEAEEARLAAAARRAFALIGARGWGRVDFMRDAEGRHWLIEVNTVPGMTSHSLVPMAARAVGMDFPELCLAILEQTLDNRAHLVGAFTGGESADGAH